MKWYWIEAQDSSNRHSPDDGRISEVCDWSPFQFAMVDNIDKSMTYHCPEKQG